MAQLTQGSTYQHSFSFSQSDVERFAEVTGDRNPVHLDAEYAAKTPFKEPIIHGFLGGSVFSRVLGTLFPGEGTIYMKQEMSFRRPMYVGRTYTAKFEITEHQADKHRAVISTVVEDENGKPAITGEALVQNEHAL
jgi:acyl dehydratase